jgi:Icc protein
MASLKNFLPAAKTPHIHCIFRTIHQPMKRRTFLELGAKTIAIIGVGNTLQSFAGEDATLPPRRKVKFRFALVSDGHFGQANTPYQQLHDEMIQWLNADHRQRKLDCCFVNGDLYHDKAEWLQPAKQQWDKLAMPYYVSHGNHDHGSEANWQEAFGVSWHYSFTKGDCGFVVLNTADEKGTYICPDLEKARALLAQRKDSKHLFVIMHIAPMKWTKYGISCPELTELFAKQQNLRAVFHGHDHDEDSMKTDNGKHYFWDAHAGGNWGTEYRGYRIVEVLKDGTIITYQMNPATGKQVNHHSI